MEKEERGEGEGKGVEGNGEGGEGRRREKEGKGEETGGKSGQFILTVKVDLMMLVIPILDFVLQVTVA